MLFGVTMGNSLMMHPLLLAERFGTRDYGRIYSTSQLVTVMGVAGCPPLIGLLYEASGGYALPFLAVAGLDAGRSRRAGRLRGAAALMAAMPCRAPTSGRGSCSGAPSHAARRSPRPRRAAEQEQNDGDVEQVPQEAVGERLPVGAVRSKMAPDIQPPSAMPTMVAMMTSPTSVPACCGGKYSRTMMAYIGTMPPWNRPNSAEMT